MNNLFDKLKPEVKALIEADLSEYPYATSDIIEHLRDTRYVNNIRYGYVIRLESYYYAAFNDHCKNAWECFIEN